MNVKKFNDYEGFVVGDFLLVHIFMRFYLVGVGFSVYICSSLKRG